MKWVICRNKGAIYHALLEAGWRVWWVQDNEEWAELVQDQD